MPIYKYNANLQIANTSVRLVRDSQHSHAIRKLASRSGFTLLEMIISLGIFSVVMITAIGAMLSVNTAQIKASHVQNIQDNIRFALESMTKEIRTGTAFRPSAPLGAGYTILTFTRNDDVEITYCVLANAIQKVIGTTCDPDTASAVTDESIVIDKMLFYVIGDQFGSTDGQPRVTVSLDAHTSDLKLETTFHLQTTVTQRMRDTS